MLIFLFKVFEYTPIMSVSRTIANQDIVVSIWYDLACRSMGGEFSSAVSSFSYFPEYAKRAKEIASDCK